MENNDITITGERARRLLELFRLALTAHDYEVIEHLRRTLAIECCRRSVKRGEISEPAVIPTTMDVERWLAIFESDKGSELLRYFQQPESFPVDDAKSA